MAMNAYFKVIGINSSAAAVATIEIMSFQWGVARDASSGTGGGAGKVSLKSITITKQPDVTSEQLVAACTAGVHFREAEIGVLVPAVQANAAPEYWKYDFTNLVASEFETGGNFAGSPLPTESVKFEFEQVAILLPAVQ